MLTKRCFFGIACRAAAFSFLMAGTTSLMQAQQQSPSAGSILKAPLFVASDSNSAGLLTPASYSSSASDSSPSSAVAEERFDLSSDAMGGSQPPPRRYGRPNYSSGNTNPDGSNKYTFMGGIGFTTPVGDTHFWETPSWGFQVGGGRNFNKNVGVVLQFDYDHFGLQGATINNEDYIYNYCTAAEYNAGECSPQGPAPSGSATPIDGNNHVWSFTLNPTYTLATQGSLGAYVVVGAGFYHKVTNFTTPSTQEYCYYFCEEVEANATFDHYTSNAAGFNGGLGVTWKFSKFSNQRFYAEVRYVFIDNSPRSGVNPQNVATAPLSATDFYPANSHRTTYIPVKFGIRF